MGACLCWLVHLSYGQTLSIMTKSKIIAHISRGSVIAMKDELSWYKMFFDPEIIRLTKEATMQETLRNHDVTV